MLAKKQTIIFTENSILTTAVSRIRHQEAHFHDNAIELLLILKGTVHMRSSHRHVTLHEGEIFSIDPGDIHCIYSDVDNAVLHIHINVINDFYSRERMYSCFFACETQHIDTYQQEALYRVSDLMLAAALENVLDIGSSSAKDITIISGKLLKLLVKHFDWLSFIWDPTDSNPMLQSRFHRIINYCQAHYKEKITISMLAEKEHFNENYFSILMKKTSFEGFNYMLNFFRCDGAEHLLLTTDQNVIEISSLCGFSDPKYFYKHFRKWWNMSPAKLRKWYKEYAVSEPDVTVLSDSESAEILQQFLAPYHIKKALKI